MKIIFLNGPPRSGKDTIGSILRAHAPEVETIKFAQPIIDHMTDTFGVSCADCEDKDAPCAALGGMSRREYAIAYSEEWIKPRLGKDWFGKKALATMERFEDSTVWVATDSGFLDEARPVVQALGRDHCLQVRLHRFGHDYSGDSRSYWHLPGVPSIDFHNNDSIDDLPQRAMSAIMEKARTWLKG